jgi:hypothetical protein
MDFPPPVIQQVQSQPYPLLFATISGAHLYDSDFDLRGVHILPTSQVIGLNTGPETIESEKIIDGNPVNTTSAARSAAEPSTVCPQHAASLT